MTFPIPPDPPAAPPTPRWRRPGWRLAGAAALVALGAAGVAARRGRPGPAAGGAPAPAGPTSPPVDDTLARAPAGQRVKVQVVNATAVRGLARRATRALRARGYDVVEVGTATPERDSTLVLDRSGHPDWARRAARAMGGARVEARPDSSRYLDLTVLVGRAWRPPPDALDP